MPKTRFGELLVKTERSPSEDIELSDIAKQLEGILWDMEQLTAAIKSSGIDYIPGKLVGGERNVQISKTGITMKSGSSSPNEIKFRKTLDGTTRAYIRGFMDESASAQLRMIVDGDTAWDNELILRCFGTTSDGAWITLKSDSSQVGSITFVVFTASTQNQVAQMLHDRFLSDYPIKIKERTASVSDDAAYGQLWVKDDNPNILRYTDGDGTEFIVDMTAA